MATDKTSKAVTAEPWQLRVLQGGDEPLAAAPQSAATPGPANPLDDSLTEQQPAQFLPRFQPAPNGKDWS